MRKRWAMGMTACVCALLMALTGCQIGNKDIVVSGTLSSRQVFTLDKSACSLKEAKVYLANYQNIYGTAYTIDLWQHDFGDASLLDYVKDITLEELTRVYTMDLLAQSQEVTLSEDETAKVAEAAKEYYASLSEDETAYMDVAEADIAEYYTHYALAQKLYHSLTNGVNEEVSDDEARVMEIMQIYVTDEDRAHEVEQKLAQGDDFASVANNYNELSAIQVTVSRDDLPDEVEEVAFQLDDNAVSGMIAAGNGYYFIKCLNKYNEELTEANKSNIVEKREKEAFDDVYNEFVASLSSRLNTDLWDGIELTTDGSIQTNSFFAVFEKYCGEI
ncbi:peptidylprolyl isomerase [Roseburia hominis]|uniref:peptidylprolyl isomerase n=1 Tax=Roseburia hominis TaxID=301301 RepID=UPI003521A247